MLVQKLQNISDDTIVGEIPWYQLKHLRHDKKWNKEDFMETLTKNDRIVLDVLWRAQQIQADMDSLTQATINSKEFQDYVQERMPLLQKVPSSKEFASAKSENGRKKANPATDETDKVLDQKLSDMVKNEKTLRE